MLLLPHNLFGFFFSAEVVCFLCTVGNRGIPASVASGQFQGPGAPIGWLLSVIGRVTLMNETSAGLSLMKPCGRKPPPLYLLLPRVALIVLCLITWEARGG